VEEPSPPQVRPFRTSSILRRTGLLAFYWCQTGGQVCVDLAEALMGVSVLAERLNDALLMLRECGLPFAS